jgi:hypothetical protein
MGEDDIAGKNNLLRRSSVKSNGFKTACLGWLILKSFAGFNVRDSERLVVMLWTRRARKIRSEGVL